MKHITNETDIALPIALWAAYDEYDYNSRENVISTTSLLNPTRMVALQRLNKDADKIVDIADLIGSRLGSAIHDSFEKVLLNEKYIKETLKMMGFDESKIDKVKINPDTVELDEIPLWIEQRTEKAIDKWIISGKYDMVINYQVQDIKSTSVWTYMFGSNNDKYIQQMSIYKWLNQDKIKKDTGVIHYIFTDWSKQKAIQDKTYPQQRVLSKEFRLMSLAQTEKFIKGKLDKLNKVLETGELPLCTSEELWQEPNKWKYFKKKSANRATKVYSTEEEAYQRLADEGQGEVKYFPGGVKRCNYCSVREFCNQYKELYELGLIKN